MRGHVGKDKRTYRSLRFRAYGKRHFIALGAVSEAEAERQLRGILADVERGIWRPEEPAPEPIREAGEISFHDFAEQWWGEHEREWRPNTCADYRWRLEVHLLPFFRSHMLTQITVAEVDRYKAQKLSELAEQAMSAQGKGQRKRLSGASINKTLTTLSAILETAVEHELLDRNNASGRRRRVKTHKPQRSYLESAAQIAALLDAAQALDEKASAGRRHIARHAMLATLIFAGLRIDELCALHWRDVDLAAGWLYVGEAKTDAGRRRIKMRGALRDAILTHRSRNAEARQEAYVFASATGSKPSADNFRTRVMGRPASVVDGKRQVGKAAIGLADDRLEAEGLPPLPAKLTPHSLRRTFASILYALGEDPGTVMDEMGHTDPALALRIYRQAMRRGEDEKAALRAIVEGPDNERDRGLTDHAVLQEA
ncbi:MAG TPA: tyrosine-type recombinase/integrase [Solirubrobacteraceae bacterium]|nr:tyrosine-type recombinase/integrase [Solirubrobacteraceae bacterium]